MGFETTVHNPYLRNGAEFIADTVDSLREDLEAVRHYFLRRLLSIQSHSSLAVLFSETGIIPICYCRIILLLKNMQSILQLSDNYLAWSALWEAHHLALNNYDSLFMEVCYILENLPSLVLWNVPAFEDLIVEYLQILIECVIKSMNDFIQQGIPVPSDI